MAEKKVVGLVVGWAAEMAVKKVGELAVSSVNWMVVCLVAWKVDEKVAMWVELTVHTLVAEMVAL